MRETEKRRSDAGLASSYPAFARIDGYTDRCNSDTGVQRDQIGSRPQDRTTFPPDSFCARPERSEIPLTSENRQIRNILK